MTIYSNHFSVFSNEVRESLFAISVKQQIVEYIHKFKQWQVARKVKNIVAGHLW